MIFDIVLNHAGDVFEYVLEDGRGEGMVPWRNLQPSEVVILHRL